jgi:CubicO group peptidase (beta-lactamase class C family)
MMSSKLYHILSLLACAFALSWSLAQGNETTYRDPGGRFTLMIPTNWVLESLDTYLFLHDPDMLIETYLLVVESGDVEEGVAAAWREVKPDFDLEVRDVTELPATKVEAAMQIVYNTPRERVVVALGRLHEGKVYVFLLDAPLDAYVTRQAQVGIIASGFDITTVEEGDLTEVEVLSFDEVMATELDLYIPKAMEQAGVAGAVVAVVQDGEVRYLRAFGVKELGKPDPVKVDTQMMIGSTGKSLTTLMMATMVDDGTMGWDTAAVEILPSFAVSDPELSRRITMRNLVCACTGVPRRDFELLFNARTLSAEDIVRSLHDFQFFTDFGEAFQYSNQMVAAGGYIAAVAAGAEMGGLLPGYAAELQRRVLNPIGMLDTTLSSYAVRARGNYATPHGLDLFNERRPIPLEVERFVLPVAPAGGHWSTAPDMARYVITLLNRGVSPDGNQVVSSENLQVTWEPQVKVSADVSYGLGWLVGEYQGVRYLSHGGNTSGFTSGLAFVPDKGIGALVLTNGRVTNFFNDHIIFRVFDRFFSEPVDDNDTDFAFTLEQLAKSFSEVVDTLEGEVDPGVVAPYLGRFTNPALGAISLTFEDGELMLDTGDSRAVLRRRVDKDGNVGYIVTDPPLTSFLLEFTNDDAGEPVIALFSPPDHYRFTRR